MFSAVIRAAVSAVLVTCALAVGQPIIGVDFGSENMKVALLRPGVPFEIVNNVNGQRNTRAYVAFDQGTRAFGADAVTLAVRKPTQTFSHFRQMLGRNMEHPATAQLLDDSYRWPLAIETDEARGTLRYVRTDLTAEEAAAQNTTMTFSVEEIAAMLLAYARDIGQVQAGGKVRDCVITVPNFFTQHERTAILDTAKLVGINVLALIDDNVAAMTQLGIDINTPENATKNVLFFNLGSNSLQIDIAKFTSRFLKKKGSGKRVLIDEFQVLSKAWDAHVGGSLFDLRLVEHFADMFNELLVKKGKTGKEADLRNLKRPIAKLKKSVAKTKKILGSNKRIPVTIQGLAFDYDFRAGTVERSTFQELIHDLMARLTPPIERALLAANLTKEEIDDVELLGGSSRIPGVHVALQAFFGWDQEGKEHPLAVHLNAEEGIALGAVYRAANLSRGTHLLTYFLTSSLTYLRTIQQSQQYNWYPTNLLLLTISFYF